MAGQKADVLTAPKPASAADRAWAEGELEKMMRDEGLTRAEALTILEKEAPSFYGIVVHGVLPPPMSEAEKREWAERDLDDLMRRNNLSRDEALKLTRQHAPTIAAWLGVV